ncbi:MAG: hypothetical protein M1562_00050 [Candidatus Marsarchaeota archaeon]|jgi:NAD+ kinase|nr:hypothetical protein [Candidatus Marsarchaeota archaeon]
MDICIVSKRDDYPELRKLRKAFNVVKSGEICIALGGDGTFVHAAMKHDVPILPIRVEENGSSGFYADFSSKYIDRVIRELKAGRYTVENAGNKLELIYKGRSYYAVNEISMNHVREEVSFRVYERNGRRRRLYPFIVAGDGLVVAGAIGSTAYNRSALGPVILSNNVMCLTFLDVDGPYRNPLIVDSGSTIEVEIAKYSCVLRYDGVDAGVLNSGDRFDVRTSDRKLRIVKMNFKRETLGNKLERIMRRRMKR